MAAALETLAELAGRSGGRPLAVLGDMLELGPAEAEAHRALGADAAARVRRLAAFGPRSRATADGALQAGLPAAAFIFLSPHFSVNAVRRGATV